MIYLEESDLVDKENAMSDDTMQQQVTKKIDFLINRFGFDVHETFEYGTGFETLKDPTNDDCE